MQDGSHLKNNTEERQMTNKQKILNCISANPGLSDRQITDIVFGVGYPQQTVNIICRKLFADGIIIRTERPVKNFLSGVKITPSTINVSQPLVKQAGKFSKLVHTRKEKLTEQLQTTFKSVCKSEVLLKDDLNLNNLLSLKTALSQVNNFITYRLTLQFINLLFGIDFITKEQCCTMCDYVEHTSSNANGFDIICDTEKKILAEVKGTVPYHDNRYGNAQSQSIIKDLKSLHQGKAKAKIENLCDYYRFMVLLNSKNCEEAINSLLSSKSLAPIRESFNIAHDGKIEKDKINIIFISLEDDTKN